ncbi:MAG: hypothetical protein OXC69_07480 [Candidatus Tectomicrobia bacterium]|nr:hypothetical protein [Candidatus Tectomicrobia bacterium]
MARAPIGSTVFVQACARLMSAAWIDRQMLETSTAPGMNTSGVAYALRFTIASDIGMAFELALKSLVQGLSPNNDGDPQVLKGHDLRSEGWHDIPPGIQDEIDNEVEQLVCCRYGAEMKGKVLPFAQYLEKHNDFLNETVNNRYALERGGTWKSEVLFVNKNVGIEFALETYDGQSCGDGIGVLTAYWYAIMSKALGVRWPDAECSVKEELCAERDEARALMGRAAHQMTGPLSIMSREELADKRLRQRTESQPSTDSTTTGEPGC